MRQQEITSAAILSEVVRTVRKKQAGLRQREAAFLCGVSPPFLNKLENHSEGCRFGMVLSVCQQLGIKVLVELPGED